MSSQTTFRTVYPPLSRLNKCDKCPATTDLRLCSSCRERVYCSEKCQKEDWNDHKRFCKQTIQVDLGKFWPLLAYLSDISRIDPARPTHPALLHKIINDPIPNETYEVINGVATNPVLLGDQIPKNQLGSTEWWSTAISPQIRRKLFWRIMREGQSLPVLLSILVALMGEMYTTTYDPAKDGNTNPTQDQFCHNKRFRLQCEGHAIIDFGICKGAVEVKEMDTLGYVDYNSFPNNPGKSFMKGQDPKDHCWIYFKTLREEFVLDLCLFTFNFGCCVRVTSYRPRHIPVEIAPEINDVGAWFETREMRRSVPKLHWERERFSVLHDKDLHTAVRTPGFTEQGQRAFIAFMDKVAGKQMSALERNLLILWSTKHRGMLASVLYHKDFLDYPDFPPIGYNFNPGEEEMMRPSPDQEEEMDRQIKRLNRRARRGKIGSAELVEGLRKVKEGNQEGRKA